MRAFHRLAAHDRVVAAPAGIGHRDGRPRLLFLLKVFGTGGPDEVLVCGSPCVVGLPPCLVDARGLPYCLAIRTPSPRVSPPSHLLSSSVFPIIETTRIIRSGIAGEGTAPSGGGAGTYTFSDAAGVKARITSTVDADGQRTSVTTDGT